ncbi:hypothetical protein JMJ35_003414 [Cladonia borealis]|uniref:Uncharacterized protein n=1 Tax=Cladonia borealis TaxID=184061 RepID=A0AA39R2G5_9LECA|nr:hypothetical protein JMJ35_003414 [Cladonia borealis]
MALTFQHSHSPRSSDSDVDVSDTSGQRTLTPNDSGSCSEGQSPDNSTSATKSNRFRTQQQPSKPPPGSGPRARSGTWKCAVHNTLATSTNSPTSAIPPANTRVSDAVAPTSPTSRPASGTKCKEVERYVNEESKVGVVICPNYGGGWSTFFHRGLEEARQTNDKLAITAIKHTIEVMMFDKEVISALLDGNRPKVVDIVRKRAGDQICRMKKLWPLEIRWVDPAEEVFVHEYDGKETLCMKRDLILWNA